MRARARRVVRTDFAARDPGQRSREVAVDRRPLSTLRSRRTAEAGKSELSELIETTGQHGFGAFR
jgi:hypothetical protein